MAKKHDENKDLSLFCRIGKINYSNKTLKTSKTTIIGNRMWGRIDFLIHYCGYVLNRGSNTIKPSNLNFEDSTISAREAKKIKKEHKLSNKKK